MLTKPPYKIVRANQADALEILIEIEYQQGYRPQGGVAVTYNWASNDFVYVQAMIQTPQDIE